MQDQRDKNQVPRLHPVIILVTHALRKFDNGNGPVDWGILKMVNVSKLCDKKREEKSDWHPDLYNPNIELYMGDDPPEGYWWRRLDKDGPQEGMPQISYVCG